MTNLLQLTLFGSPEVHLYGQAVTGFRSSKAQALLYYLAVTGRSHTRPTLAGLLWGDQVEAAARTSLSKCLSNLRDLVGDAVLVDRQTVAFNRHQPYQLDTERFLTGIGQPLTSATIESWPAALALYRGDFLEGFYVRGAPDFEQWVLIQRAHYREVVVQGLHTLSNWYDQQGDLASAITHTRHLLTLEPWREETHRQLMTRLARSGQRAAALAQFETCRRVLEEELAVEPDAETIAVAEAIRSSTGFIPVESGVAPTVRHNLPGQTTPFIGRQRELIEVERLCRIPDARLITILGSGGMGKTRLVLEIALRQVEQARHDVYFVALAAIRENAHIVPAIAETIGFQFHTDGRSPKQQLLDYLRQKKILLVLDNFEHLLDSAALVHEMIQASIHLRILVTSRERLQLSSETIFILDGMGFPVSATPQEALTYSAVQLFAETAQHVRADFTLNAHNVHDMVRICRLVGGMPLALKLAAGWVDVLPVATIADEIQKSIDFLESSLRDLPLRQRSMRATFDSSWQLLSPAEQAVLAQIAVFRGSFDRQAAGEVVGASLRTLAALVAKSWLQVSPSRERYDVHELVKQYGIAKMQVDPEAWTATRVRHCCYYAAFLHKQMESVKAKPHLHEVEQVFDDIQMAWRYAIENRQLAQIQQLADSFLVYYRLQSWYRAGTGALALYQQALAYFEPETQNAAHRATLSCLYESIGDLQGLTTAYEEALTGLKKALETTVDIDYLPRGRLYGKVANILMLMNQHEQAHEYYILAESVLALAHQQDAAWWGEWLRIKLQQMELYYWQNRPDDIAELARQIGPLLDQHGSVVQRVRYLHALYLEAVRRDRYFYSNDAIAYSGQALTLSLETGNLNDIATRHFNHGFSHLWSDHLDEAQTHLQIAGEMTEQNGDLMLLARAVTYLAVVYRKRGDREKVHQLAAQGLKIATEAKMPQYTGIAQANQAWLAWCAGDLAETKWRASAANEEWRGLGQAQSVVVCRWLAPFPLLGVDLQEEKIEDAILWAQELITPSQQRLPNELTTLLERAVTVGDDGRAGLAYDLLYQAFQLAQALHYV